MIARKVANPKLKSSSKAKPKTFAKFKTIMEAKELKSPSFSTSAKNWLKPSQPEVGSCTFKKLKIITKKFAKEKTPSLMDKNTNSSKNKKEEEVSSENKLGYSTYFDHYKKEEDTQKGTSSMQLIRKLISLHLVWNLSSPKLSLNLRKKLLLQV